MWYLIAFSARGTLALTVPPAAILLGAIGMVLITAFFAFRQGGSAAIRDWLALSVATKASVSLYLAALIPFALILVSFAVLPALGIDVQFSPALGVGLVGILIPVWIEETVWRGYALPRLLEIHNPLTASSILAIVWVFWHIPFYLMPGYNAWGMGGWLAWLPFYAAYTFFLTWLGLRTQFSVLIAVMSHFAVNWLISSSAPPYVENYLAIIAAILLAPIAYALVARVPPRRNQDGAEKPAP